MGRFRLWDEDDDEDDDDELEDGELLELSKNRFPNRPIHHNGNGHNNGHNGRQTNQNYDTGNDTHDENDDDDYYDASADQGHGHGQHGKYYNSNSNNSSSKNNYYEHQDREGYHSDSNDNGNGYSSDMPSSSSVSSAASSSFSFLNLWKRRTGRGRRNNDNDNSWYDAGYDHNNYDANYNYNTDDYHQDHIDFQNHDDRDNHGAATRTSTGISQALVPFSHDIDNRNNSQHSNREYNDNNHNRNHDAYGYNHEEKENFFTSSYNKNNVNVYPRKRHKSQSELSNMDNAHFSQQPQQQHVQHHSMGQRYANAPVTLRPVATMSAIAPGQAPAPAPVHYHIYYNHPPPTTTEDDHEYSDDDYDYDDDEDDENDEYGYDERRQGRYRRRRRRRRQRVGFGSSLVPSTSPSSSSSSSRSSCAWFLLSLVAVTAHIMYWYGPSSTVTYFISDSSTARTPHRSAVSSSSLFSSLEDNDWSSTTSLNYDNDMYQTQYQQHYSEDSYRRPNEATSTPSSSWTGMKGQSEETSTSTAATAKTKWNELVQQQSQLITTLFGTWYQLLSHAFASFAEYSYFPSFLFSWLTSDTSNNNRNGIDADMYDVKQPYRDPQRQPQQQRQQQQQLSKLPSSSPSSSSWLSFLQPFSSSPSPSSDKNNMMDPTGSTATTIEEFFSTHLFGQEMAKERLQQVLSSSTSLSSTFPIQQENYDSFLWLYITGRPGVGKHHLAELLASTSSIHRTTSKIMMSGAHSLLTLMPPPSVSQSSPSLDDTTADNDYYGQGSGRTEEDIHERMSSLLSNMKEQISSHIDKVTQNHKQKEHAAVVVVVELSHVERWEISLLQNVISHLQILEHRRRLRQRQQERNVTIIVVMTSHVGQDILDKVLRKSLSSSSSSSSESQTNYPTKNAIPSLELESYLWFEIQKYHQEQLEQRYQEQLSAPSSSSSSLSSSQYVLPEQMIALPMFPLDYKAMEQILKQQLLSMSTSPIISATAMATPLLDFVTKRTLDAILGGEEQHHHGPNISYSSSSTTSLLEWQTWVQKSTGRSLCSFVPNGAKALIPIIETIQQQLSDSQQQQEQQEEDGYERQERQTKQFYYVLDEYSTTTTTTTATMTTFKSSSSSLQRRVVLQVWKCPIMDIMTMMMGKNTDCTTTATTTTTTKNNENNNNGDNDDDDTDMNTVLECKETLIAYCQSMTHVVI